jgi:hypothetical protein
MKRKALWIAVVVLAFGFASATAGAVTDQVTVRLPYPVTVGERVLEPGEYLIRQMGGLGGDRWVVQIFRDQGMKHETTVMTIPTVGRKTPNRTVVQLHRFPREEYYFDKIWIQGKDYGYEFILPDRVKSREKERRGGRTLAARYEQVSDESEGVSAAPADTPETVPAPGAEVAEPATAPETPASTP